jgi:hypothetical protein
MKKQITSRDYTISDGDEGTYETVSYMWNYALRDTKEALVKQLVSKLERETEIETIKSIYDWVWKNIRYENDPPDMEQITTPIHFVNGNKRGGDCDCMTTLLICLLETAGFEVAITVIAWREDYYTHVFAEVFFNNSWFILDPTLKQGGFGEQDKQIKRYKRITKDDMAKLRVLADGESGKIKRIPHTQQKRNCNGRCNGYDDANKNTNNISINFGTSVENSHNRAEYDEKSNIGNNNTHNRTSKPSSSDSIPSVVPVWKQSNRNQEQQSRQPVLLKPIIDKNGRTTFRRDEYNEIISSTNSEDTMISQGKIMLLRTNRPKNYIVPTKKRSGYVEFP